MIKFENVSYSNSFSLFGAKDFTLKNVNFQLESGDSLAVIGRNGAGKSTLLRLIAGIAKPDGGIVSVNYNSPLLLSLQVGFDPNLSGVDNIILGGLLLGASMSEIKKLKSEIIAYSGLTEKEIKEKLYSYSDGMRARLGFSIAVHIHCELLLIDEILSVGDLDFQTKSFQTLKSLICSDITTVLVSHDISAVRQLCNKCLWLENGSVIDFGYTDTILERYEASF